MPPALSSCLHCGKALAASTPGQGGVRKFCSAKCMARLRYLLLNHRPEKPCRRCGTVIAAGSHSNRDYCSKDCKKAVDSDVSRQRYPGTYVVRRYQNTCAVCGSGFVARRKHGKVCSRPCLNRWKLSSPKFRADLRMRADARRALIRGAERALKFDAYVIFERDNWTCQMCGLPTPKMLRGTTQQNAPELDHIIPLSKGGEHTPSNTQCACLRCNRRKSAKVAA